MAESSRSDSKKRALEERGVPNPAPERVTAVRFGTEPFFDPRDLVQVKYEMLRQVRAVGATVTEATDAFGFSRPTFYQARRALEEAGLPGLLPTRPGPKRAHKLTEEVMTFVDGRLAEDRAVNAKELSQSVRERFGLSVHPRSIERALARRKKKRRRSR